LAGGQLFSYAAGTTTPQNTFSDTGGLTPNTNPVILDSTGSATVRLDPSLAYKFILEDLNGSVQWSEDNYQTNYLTGTIIGTTLWPNTPASLAALGIFAWNYTTSQTIYVNSSTGNDANNGLAVGTPFLTIQAACNSLVQYGPSLGGTWTVQGAAGSYNEQVNFPENLRGINRIIIQGPIVNHPNVPTLLLDGTTGAKAYGLNFNGNNKMVLSNLKLQNYTTYGAVSQDDCDITCINVHSQSIANGAGIKMQGPGRLRAEGGIHTSNQWGIEVIGGVTASLGASAASTADGIQMLNCTQAGLFVQERTSGDAFYMTMDNCAIGADLNTHARFRLAGNAIKNNATAGVRYAFNSGWQNDPVTPNVFTGNTTDWIAGAGGVEGSRQSMFGSRLSPTQDITAVSHTGDALEFTLKTFTSAIPTNHFNSLFQAWGIDLGGVLTGTAGTKTIRIKVAGGTLATSTITTFVIPAAQAGKWILSGVVYAKTPTAQSLKFMSTVDGNASQCDVGSLAFSMNAGADLTVTVTCQNAAAGDTTQINNVDRWEKG
jgi:hypothetical protein